MSAWATQSLGERVINLDRRRVPVRGADRRPGPYPYYGASGIVDYVDEYIFEGLHLLVAEDGENLRSRKTPIAFLADGQFWVNNHAHILLANDWNDTRFLAYALEATDVSGYITGSTQPKLTQTALSRIPVSAPAVDEQRAIAAALGALDDKMASNQRAVELIEALGAALLEAGLSVVDVFGFPEYDERRLGDVLSLLETGSRPKGGVVVSSSGVASLGAENIQSAGVSSNSQFKRVTEEFATTMKRGRLEDEDVLVYKDGGKPGNFKPHVSAFGYGFPVDVATINEHVYRVRAGEGISQALLYWLLRSPWMDQEMRKRGTGVAIPGLNSSNFRELPFPVLEDHHILQLNDRLTPLFRALLRKGAQNRHLATLRNTLTPELLSGRIVAPDLLETVEEIVA